MTFSDKCKSLGITRSILSKDSGVPIKTLGTWYTTKPLLMEMLFSNYDNELIRRVNNAECLFERSKVTIDTLKNELSFKSRSKNTSKPVVKSKFIPKPNENLDFLVNEVLLAISEQRDFDFLSCISILVRLDDGKFDTTTRLHIKKVIFHYVKTLSFPRNQIIEFSPDEIINIIEIAYLKPAAGVLTGFTPSNA